MPGLALRQFNPIAMQLARRQAFVQQFAMRRRMMLQPIVNRNIMVRQMFMQRMMMMRQMFMQRMMAMRQIFMQRVMAQRMMFQQMMARRFGMGGPNIFNNFLRGPNGQFLINPNGQGINRLVGANPLLGPQVQQFMLLRNLGLI